MYHHSIRVIVVCSLSLVLLASCQFSTNENKANDEWQTRLKEDSLTLEKERLELEAKKLAIARQRIELMEEKQTQRENAEIQVEWAKKANNFEMNPSGVVITEKAFFHEKADLNTRKKAYLMRGDQFTATYVSRDFVFVSYDNMKNGKTTSGFIHLGDVENVSW
jgi:hypothetical protein